MNGKNQQDAYIISATRTPIGSFGGTLKNTTATELASLIIKSVVDKAKIAESAVDIVYMGNCFDPIANNIARISSVKAGIPIEKPGITISSTCGSGMQAIICGVQAIRDGSADIIVSGGVESMSTAPFISTTNRWGQRLRHSEMIDLVWKAMQEYPLGVGMGLTAENVAERDNISREEQDKLALTSQNRAIRAIKEGKFKEEITPVKIPQRKGDIKIFDTDEHPRDGLTLDDLASLPPVFKKGGSVTAGNSSGINDGAAAVVIISGNKAKEMGIKPLARILNYSVVGVDPNYMGDGPVPATKKVLKKAGINLNNIDLIELNEAFASTYISCEKALELNRNITNVNGSGIALGHPVGCTGCRIVVTLIHEMKRRKLNLGLATLCAGGGQGFAMILEGV